MKRTVRLGFLDYYLGAFVLIDIEANLYVVFRNKFIKDGFDEFVAVETDIDTLCQFIDKKIKLTELFKDKDYYTVIKDEYNFLCLTELSPDIQVDLTRTDWFYNDFDPEESSGDGIWIQIFCKRIIKDKQAVIEHIKEQIDKFL